MSDLRVSIVLETDAVFTIEELWPDGDAPEEVTREAVEALIKEWGGPNRILVDWGFNLLAVGVDVFQVRTHA